MKLVEDKTFANCKIWVASDGNEVLLLIGIASRYIDVIIRNQVGTRDWIKRKNIRSDWACVSSDIETVSGIITVRCVIQESGRPFTDKLPTCAITPVEI